ncbi:CPBP family intramembrane glutamic endopeptidase [Enterococcus termitis]
MNLPTNQKIIIIIHFLMIAFAEEFFYRYFIFNIISQNARCVHTVIITSLIFAFVGHISEPFLDNLLYRLPLGILFSVIRVWSKSISVPTVIHAIYNLLIII